ncbi:hypothetical protein PUN28_011694 [Cardiocondyla obscurior]|uniref:Uncharacterized protein n=1 Tax=Cardiocondyla obscurior TaxID=286306 RepID=A0AAW2FHI8_9HYME
MHAHVTFNFAAKQLSFDSQYRFVFFFFLFFPFFLFCSRTHRGNYFRCDCKAWSILRLRVLRPMWRKLFLDNVPVIFKLFKIEDERLFED